jgi:hypothetical protein
VPADEIAALLVARGSKPADAAVAAALADGSVARGLALSSDDTISARAETIEKACSLNNYSAIFAFGELFDKDREKAVTALDFIISFWRDMLTLLSGSAETVNRDMTEILSREAQKRSSRTIMENIDNIMTTRRAIQRNANVRLAMDLLGMKLSTSR